MVLTKVVGAAALTAALLAGAPVAQAEGIATVSGSGKIMIPESSGLSAAKQKEVMSTHVLVFMPAQRLSPYVGPPKTGTFIETPASLACIYGLVAPTAGCNPNTVTAVATGGSRAIAVVDAYHNPTAAADLMTYSQQFGLPRAISPLSTPPALGSRPCSRPPWTVRAGGS